jgi:hypothetical protein
MASKVLYGLVACFAVLCFAQLLDAEPVNSQLQKRSVRKCHLNADLLVKLQAYISVLALAKVDINSCDLVDMIEGLLQQVVELLAQILDQVGDVVKNLLDDVLGDLHLPIGK